MYRARARRTESGASAVEFALVSTVLFLVLFGIIQYGLYFNDSLNTRQGVREAARKAVVENFGFASGCTTGPNSDQLRCSAAKDIDATSGTTYVKVKAASWAKGSPVTVCAMVHSDGVLGLLPMPDGGWIRSKTEMSIEQITKAGTWTNTQDSLAGTGRTWGWCP